MWTTFTMSGSFQDQSPDARYLLVSILFLSARQSFGVFRILSGNPASHCAGDYTVVSIFTAFPAFLQESRVGDGPERCVRGPPAREVLVAFIVMVRGIHATGSVRVILKLHAQPQTRLLKT